MPRDHLEWRKKARPLLSIAALLFLCCPASAEILRFGAFTFDTDFPAEIWLDQDITAAAPIDLTYALKSYPAIETVALSSYGGSVIGGLGVAHIVFQKGLNTYIPRDRGCYSACAYIFFAGKERHADGELGVHQVYGEGLGASMAQSTVADIIDAFDLFGVPAVVLSRMFRTAPEGMYIYSESEAAALGFNRGTPNPASVAVTVVNRNDLARSRGGNGDLNLIDRYFTTTKLKVIMSVFSENGFTQPMMEAIYPILVGTRGIATIPAGTRIHILVGISRTSETLPLQASFYTPPTVAGAPYSHLATIGLNDEGHFVEGLDPWAPSTRTLSGGGHDSRTASWSPYSNWPGQ